jgi:hypothetical protein
MSFSFQQQVESATSSETVCNWSFLIIQFYCDKNFVYNFHASLLSVGKFQTEIGKNWAAEIASRRKSTPAKKQN